MTISRRHLIKGSLAAGTVVSMPSVLQAQITPAAAQTVHMVLAGDLRIFDPIYTSANITLNHALAVYDTLFGLDSKLMPQPQMLRKWEISDDKKTYTFELRDGLGFHDGTPVTSADCVASIRRWAQVDAGGQQILARAKDISKKDDRTFAITLKEPLGLLLDLLAYSGNFLAIMREKDADRPPTEQVTANIGSGPFKFNEALAKPGVSFVYDRNEKYVPRQEPPDGLAGGKVVKIDRAVWEIIADPQTAFAALQAGEVDFLESPPSDLYSTIESDPNLVLENLHKTGSVVFLRLNFLHKPFDNMKARQAMLRLIDQEAFVRVMRSDPKFGRAVSSMFGNGTLYSNDENTGWFKRGGDPEKAKQLFKEAGYAGEKIVILDPTNIKELDSSAQLLAASLRKIGINAELASGDWGQIVARRGNKGSVENGGWSIFISSWSDFSQSNPMSAANLAANGEKAWFGWPKNDEYEGLRVKWADVDTLAERKALAQKMQNMWWDFVGEINLGDIDWLAARRKELVDLIGVPGYIPMWNMRKD